MKLLKKENTGIQKVYNTNVDNNHNYIAHGICNHNCVVDFDYQGEIHINLHNVGPTKQIIRNGDKVIQFILVNVLLSSILECSSLEELYENMTSERGTGMAGSTGTNSKE